MVSNETTGRTPEETAIGHDWARRRLDLYGEVERSLREGIAGALQTAATIRTDVERDAEAYLGRLAGERQRLSAELSDLDFRRQASEVALTERQQEIDASLSARLQKGEAEIARLRSTADEEIAALRQKVGEEVAALCREAEEETASRHEPHPERDRHHGAGGGAAPGPGGRRGAGPGGAGGSRSRA